MFRICKTLYVWKWNEHGKQLPTRDTAHKGRQASSPQHVVIVFVNYCCTVVRGRLNGHQDNSFTRQFIL